MNTRVGKQNQQGQALTEFLVAALVLVPLFMLVPMIGKFQDISHATLMASRYVAFDAMVRNDSINSWKPEAQVANEVRRRFFGDSKSPIKTDDAAGDFTADRNMLWVDPANKPLIEKFDRDVLVTFGPANGVKHTDGFTSAHDHEAFLGRSRFDLPARGIYNANVTVSVANLQSDLEFLKPFDALNLRITRTTAVLLDPWAGRSPADVQGRLDNILVNPAAALAPMAPVLDIAVRALDGNLLTLGSVRGPKIGKLEFWTDVVQPDRLR